MTSLRLGYLFLQSANGLAIIPGCDRRYRGFERTGFLEAPSLHVFQKLRPDFGFFDQLENCLGLAVVYRSSSAVVIILGNHNVEDVAGDVSAEERIVAPARVA